MIKDCKICGVTDSETLKYIINHPFPAKYIGFICNYKKSPRYLKFDKLKKLINVNKKKSKFVAVLVNPDRKILEKIQHLKFDYYQIYDCSPDEIKKIKERYKKKIISAFTIKNALDVEKYKLYKNISDIFLFDSKGYEKSMSFKHSLIKNIKFNKKVMLAGNIQYDDELEKYKKIADIIDISGGLETSGLKDISKIEIFLNKIKKLY
ncbi:phosphoribosylanthranilate isomerase [Pelagibacterales bacterium SAG-MED47]|nr:phosphoribosylanthranilate isomerase [Pelagibacterales bacterium SAG-MED47]